MRQEWHLFIDESGQLDPGSSDPAVVGGVLLRRPIRHTQLRDALGAVFEGLAYPAHASALRYLSGWLTAAMRGRAPGVEALTSSLHRCGSDSAQRLLEATEVGREPRHDDLRLVDRWLRREAAHTAQAIQARQLEIERRLRGLWGELSASYGAHVLAAASSSSSFDPPVDPVRLGAAEPDRYLSLLEALLERLMLLGRSGAPRLVRVWVATRDVGRRGFVRSALQHADVGPLAMRALAYPDLASMHGFERDGLRVVIERTERYDAGVHSGVVLADFAANQLRRPLLERRTSWADLAGGLVAPIEARAEARPDAGLLPSVAADGPARRALRAALQGQTSDEAPTAPWETDQLERWRGAIR